MILLPWQRLFNYLFHLQGNCGENTAKKFNITREQQDAYAIESYKRSQKAASSGVLDKEIVPVAVPQRKGKCN